MIDELIDGGAGCLVAVLEFTRRWLITILVVIAGLLLLAGMIYFAQKDEDDCRAKGGHPIHEQGHGVSCLKSRETVK